MDVGRKSAFKRAYKEAHNEGLRKPRRKPQLSTKYREDMFKDPYV